MDLQGLPNGVESDGRVGPAAVVLDGIDGGAGEVEDLGGQATGLNVHQIEDQIALIKRPAQAIMVGDAGDRSGQGGLGGEPLGAEGAGTACRA